MNSKAGLSGVYHSSHGSRHVVKYTNRMYYSHTLLYTSNRRKWTGLLVQNTTEDASVGGRECNGKDTGGRICNGSEWGVFWFGEVGTIDKNRWADTEKEGGKPPKIS